MRLLYIEIKEQSDSTISFDSYLPILLSYKKPCSWLAHNSDNLAQMIQGYYYAKPNPRDAEDLFAQAVFGAQHVLVLQKLIVSLQDRYVKKKKS